jgi:hypothetical protein
MYLLLSTNNSATATASQSKSFTISAGDPRVSMLRALVACLPCLSVATFMNIVKRISLMNLKLDEKNESEKKLRE